MAISVVDDDLPAENLEVSVARRLTLSQMRKRKLLSAPELAKLSGVGVSTIRDIEVRRKHPRLSTIKRLAAALDVQPEEIDWPGNPLELEDGPADSG